MNFMAPYHSHTTPSTPDGNRPRGSVSGPSNRPNSNPFFATPSSQAGPSTPISTRPTYESPFSLSNVHASPSNSQAPPQDLGPPIVRSRTLFYLSVRDSSANTDRARRYKRRKGGYGAEEGGRSLLGTGERDGEERAGLMGKEEEGVQARYRDIEPASTLPPKWVDTMDEIEDIISRVKLKIASLEKLHAKHALPGFTDRTAEEREIESQTNEITRDFRKIHSLITGIHPSSNTPNEITAARNVQRGLAVKVQDLSSAFRRKQRVYMDTLQGHANKNRELMTASGAISLKGPERYDELQDDLDASNSHLTQAQAQLHRPNLSAQIAKRDHELTQIAKSISELADLFQSLSSLVLEQGTILDCVEYNVQQTEKEIRGAGEELKVAERYQRRSGRRKCILLLVLIIVGLFIVLIYKPRGNGHGKFVVDEPLIDIPEQDEQLGNGIGGGLDFGTGNGADEGWEIVHEANPEGQQGSGHGHYHGEGPRPTDIIKGDDEAENGSEEAEETPTIIPAPVPIHTVHRPHRPKPTRRPRPGVRPPSLPSVSGGSDHPLRPARPRPKPHRPTPSVEAGAMAAAAKVQQDGAGEEKTSEEEVTWVHEVEQELEELKEEVKEEQEEKQPEDEVTWIHEIEEELEELKEDEEEKPEEEVTWVHEVEDELAELKDAEEQKEKPEEESVWVHEVEEELEELKEALEEEQ